MIRAYSICGIGLLILAMSLIAIDRSLADVLTGVNGEKFIGRIVEERINEIVFESETVGRLTVPRSRILSLQKSLAGAGSSTTNQPSAVATVLTNAWQPPTIGKDGFDWIQLKSDEWLKGHINYVLNKKIQFESDKLEDLSLDWKDVRRLYSAKPMFVKFDDRGQVFGSVVVNSNIVEVIGPEQLELPRAQLTGITPGGQREINFWSGKLNVGLNFQAGNSKQANANASGELARRTPATQFILSYMGNYSEVEGSQNANNHRANLSYDVRLNKDWFLRPVQLEYYRDQLANIAHRGTAGVGGGYYIFDRDNIEWKASAGPGYQYTVFENVAAGESDTASTPAGIIQTRLKYDITSRWTWIEDFSAVFASQDAGLYSHHFVSSLEFEIKRYLDLNISLVWDFLSNPQREESGTIPQHSDFRLTVGIGAKF